jgi:hypothetical protein
LLRAKWPRRSKATTGQFVGKRVGRARAGMCEERSDDRSPPMARSRTQ